MNVEAGLPPVAAPIVERGVMSPLSRCRVSWRRRRMCAFRRLRKTRSSPLTCPCRSQFPCVQFGRNQITHSDNTDKSAISPSSAAGRGIARLIRALQPLGRSGGRRFHLSCVWIVAQQSFAVAVFAMEEAGVGWHGFLLGEAAQYGHVMGEVSAMSVMVVLPHSTTSE